MYYFRQEYPFGPPRTMKGKCIINYGGKEIVCENAEVTMQPVFVTSATPPQIASFHAPSANYRPK
jgi:hypothetical protein